MEEIESVQIAKAAIAKIERENVNVHQFFPILKHSFQKPSTTEASNFWLGLVSSVSGKAKKSKVVQPSSETVATKAITEDTNILLPTQSEEEKEYATFDELRIFSPDSNSENFVASTELAKAVQYNYDDEGYFETAADAEKCKRSNNIMRCQSILDPFVWVTYKAQLAQCSSDESFSVQKTSFALTVKAKYDEQHGDYESSLRKHNKIVALNPNDPFWMADRAEVSLHLGDLQSAIYDYRRAFHLFKSCFVFKFRLAKLYCFQGQVYLDLEMYQNALEAFIKAATLVPDQIVYKAKCCSCLINLKCFDQAWVILNKLLNQNPNNTDLILMKARLYHITGEYSSSFQAIKAVLSQGENSIASMMLEQVTSKAEQFRCEAMNLNIQKQFYPAIKKISLAISLYPTEAKSYLLRGILHRHVEDFNSSIDDLVMALKKCSLTEKENIQKEAQHQLLLTFNDFSLECFAKGFLDEAIQLLNRAIAGEKNEKGLYLNRAECFYQKMNYNFSLQDYQQALELDPNDTSILPKIASVYYVIGVEKYMNRNYEDALKTLTLAIEHAPTMGQYYITRCKCFQMLQKLNCARCDLMIGMQLIPTNKQIIPLLAYLFPSTSFVDIMAHPLAIQAKYIVQNLLNRPKSTHYFPPLSNDQSNQNGENCLDSPSIAAKNGFVSRKTQLSTLPKNSISTVNLVSQKKKINCKIQETLKKCKPPKPIDANLDLKSTGPNWINPWKVGHRSTWQRNMLKRRTEDLQVG